MEIFVSIALAVALAIAAFTDIRSQKIYNWLTFPLILAGFLAHTVYGGLEGLKFAGGGFSIGLIAMGIPYLFGAMGAGDVKLMAGVGAWLGFTTTLVAFLFTCIAGGVYCIIVLIRDPSLFKAAMRNIKNTMYVLLVTRKMNFAPTTTAEKAMPRLCYGVAIAAGTVAAMALWRWETGSMYAGY